MESWSCVSRMASSEVAGRPGGVGRVASNKTGGLENPCSPGERETLFWPSAKYLKSALFLRQGFISHNSLTSSVCVAVGKVLCCLR